MGRNAIPPYMRRSKCSEIKGVGISMADFFTTRQLQEILQVDRTTIYRMADKGRLPAVKIGNQWRFPQDKIQQWLQNQSDPAMGGHSNGLGQMTKEKQETPLAEVLPLECVQLIVDTFADTLGVMLVITDLAGNPITRPSNPCGLYGVADSSEGGVNACMQLWAQMANRVSLQPTFMQSHIGLLCARALVRVGNELGAMVVAGGIAPAQWPPSQAEIDRISARLELDPEQFRAHVGEVFHLDADEQSHLLHVLQRIADIVAHIATEHGSTQPV